MAAVRVVSVAPGSRDGVVCVMEVFINPWFVSAASSAPLQRRTNSFSLSPRRSVFPERQLLNEAKSAEQMNMHASVGSLLDEQYLSRRYVFYFL